MSASKRASSQSPSNPNSKKKVTRKVEEKDEAEFTTVPSADPSTVPLGQAIHSIEKSVKALSVAVKKYADTLAVRALFTDPYIWHAAKLLSSTHHVTVRVRSCGEGLMEIEMDDYDDAHEAIFLHDSWNTLVSRFEEYSTNYENGFVYVVDT
jgi:hypothetical protein